MLPAADSNEFKAAKDEADRIHDENLEHPPARAEGTVYCHIITDSMLSAEQAKALKVGVEQEIGRRAERGENFPERVVFLSGADTSDKDAFIRALTKKMQDKVKDYTGEGYTDVLFDVACPDTELVNEILNRKLKTESGEDIKALAFEMPVDGVYSVVQAEGIIRALRALHSDDLRELKAAFVSLARAPLSAEWAAINDIDTFIRTVPFILPVSTIEDYEERRRINALIAKNIWQAA